MLATAHDPLLSEGLDDGVAGDVQFQGQYPDSDDNATLDDPDAADRGILEDDAAQHESLLNKQPKRASLFGRSFERSQRAQSSSPYRKRGRQLKELAEGSGNAEVMYEMEGGYKDTSSRSSSESATLKKEDLHQNNYGWSFLRIALISSMTIVTFVAFVVGAYRASKRSNSSLTFSNGTHAFGPTTILISLDGFRADFLHRGLTPGLNAIVASGVSPQYMLPSFPSLTFPNHFTLATGLYPESHGIVSNQFWDPNLGEEFYYTNISNSMQPKWWNAEPLWVTAENQGVRTAIHMWPGSEAHIANMDPTYLDKYNGSEALDVKVDRILGWLDMPETERPQFIAAYVPNVDADGHTYGPNSTEIRKTIVEVDSMLTSLLEGLLLRNLTEVVNLVIVSDHGMATTSTERLYQLDDFIDMDLVDHMDGWPLRGLRLKNPKRDVPILHQQLLAASEGKAFEVYNLTTMPERYHFSNNDRIAPLWVVPDAGWVVIEKADFHVAQARAGGISYYPNGLHGYDHEHPLMRAIFVARGPAFPHAPNSRVAAFQNIEVYNIVCDSLGIQPHTNNGTLRLPLAVEGLHSELDEPVKIPADPVEIAPQISTATSPTASPPSQASRSTSASLSSTFSSTSTSTPSVNSESNESNAAPPKNWLKFLQEKVDQAKEWAKHFMDSLSDKNSTKADSG